MSQINFDLLIAERPDLLNAFGSLETWLNARPQVRFVELPRVARELGYVPEEELVQVLQVLVEHDLAKRQYQVESPDGDLTGATFSSYSAVPARLKDRFERYEFDRDEGRIIPGFVFVEQQDG
jgi:hypothetical protein